MSDDNLCLCGCGEPTVSTDEKGRPRKYLPGHLEAMRAKRREDRPCACGCGTIIPAPKSLASWKPARYIKGHQNHRNGGPRPQNPCGCGCGQLAPLGYRNRPTKYIPEHLQAMREAQAAETARRERELAERYLQMADPDDKLARICLCGCGQTFRVSPEAHSRQYMPGHQRRPRGGTVGDKPITLERPRFNDEPACASASDPEVFFADSLPASPTGSDVELQRKMIDMAKQYCKGCPVRAECLDWALDRNEPYGIWGGLLPRERHNIRRSRQRALLREARSA